MATSTTAVNVSGFTSSTYGSFDWQTMVNELVAADSTPLTNLQAEQTTNESKISALATLTTDLTTLQNDVQALQMPSLFTARTTTVNDPTWNATAADSTATGTLSINVTRLATEASLDGKQGISNGLSTSNNVNSLTLATLPTATAVTAGTFTVDGQPVTIALSDSLQDVFTKINNATGNRVTASYNHLTDKITLANTNPLDTSEIVLGAVNDSSNFLQAMQLANNASSSVSSSASLGTAALNVPIAQAGLRTAITAVDPSGNGSFSINGVPISYNVNTDSLSAVLARINASTAGVTVTYNAANDQVTLTNNSTGDIGLGANEAFGGLLGALGLTTGSTFVHGVNAQVSVNGGPVVSSASNTFGQSILGIAGLSVTAGSATTQNITVGANTSAMQTAIQSFVSDYNAVQSYITSETSITTGTDGKVQAALLAGNNDLGLWASGLEASAFAPVSGLSGSIKQLADLGLDFNAAGQLSATNNSTLVNALANKSSDVAAFFATPATGFADTVNNFLTNLLNPGSGVALLKSSLTSQDTDLASQITTLQSKLDQERTSLTTAFEAMQSAQTTAQSQLAYLTQANALSKNGS